MIHDEVQIACNPKHTEAINKEALNAFPEAQHFFGFKCKIEGDSKIINELEKNEKIDVNLLRYLTIRVKKFDLETNYFGKKEDSEKKESAKN